MNKIPYCTATLFLMAWLAQAEDKPNILWIITDDQRPDSWACYNKAVYGSESSPLGYVESPAADALAAEGTLFTQSYCNSPACAPSRASMITGRYPFRSGIYGFEQTHDRAGHMRPVVPEVLRQNGYATALFGKTGYFIFRWKDGNTWDSLDFYSLEFDPTEILKTDPGKQGLTDMFINIPWAGGRRVGTEEIYNYPDGKQKRFFTDRDSDPLTEADIETRQAVESELSILRAHTTMVPDLIIGGQSPQTAEKTLDGLLATALIRYLDSEADGNEPQFIQLSFHFPHTPVLPPKEIRDRFIAEEKRTPYRIPMFTTEELKYLPPQLRLLQEKMNFADMNEAEKRQAIRDYYAFCAFGDSQAARCIDAFKQFSVKSGRDWLIIYVCGDHSWHLGEQGIAAKFGPWQMSTRGAVIAASSNPELFPPGTVCDDLTEYVDFAPTFFEAAGIDLSSGFEHLDGISLIQAAAQQRTARDYVVGELNHVVGPRAYLRSKAFAFSMRTRPTNTRPGNELPPGENIRWALDCPREEAELCLYDLRTDPHEHQNVADHPAYVALADWLREKLGSIVLGDRRVECDWGKENTWVLSDFSTGSDDKRLDIPAALLPPKEARTNQTR